MKTANGNVELVGECDPYSPCRSISIRIVHYDGLIGYEKVFGDA
jgi:hypothetical protein